MIKIYYKDIKQYKDGKPLNCLIPEKIVLPNGTEIITNKIDKYLIEEYLNEDVEIYRNDILKSIGKIVSVDRNTNAINIYEMR